jgi:23S rRNA (uridine2552-2'-O)-methyltransferase
MKRKADFFSRLARSRGFPARSVFKLQEIQDRFRVIPRGARILDIGASPGSWSRYCLQLLGGRGAVVGVDLVPPAFTPAPRDRYRFIQGSIFDREVLEACREAGPFEVILSDAAPSTAGNRIVDSERSLELAEQVLRIAAVTLLPRGNVVMKLFQGGSEGELLRRLRTLCGRARTFKPGASRKESMEVYLIGFSWRKAGPESAPQTEGAPEG